MSQDFAIRAGWLASDSKDRNCTQVAGDHASQPPKHFSCSVAVGTCRIETTVEITDSPALLESSAPLFESSAREWHIHIGEEDFKALKRCGWENQICYVDAIPQEGNRFCTLYTMQMWYCAGPWKLLGVTHHAEGMFDNSKQRPAPSTRYSLLHANSMACAKCSSAVGKSPLRFLTSQGSTLCRHVWSKVHRGKRPTGVVVSCRSKLQAPRVSIGLQWHHRCAEQWPRGLHTLLARHGNGSAGWPHERE